MADVIIDRGGNGLGLLIGLLLVGLLAWALWTGVIPSPIVERETTVIERSGDVDVVPDPAPVPVNP